MRIANLSGRLVLLRGELALDVETISQGRFSSLPQGAYDVWDALYDWAADVDFSEASPYITDDLLAPVPIPRQVIAIGLNYRDHAAEANLPTPEHPMVFTKFASSIAGPNAEVPLPEGNVDWEAELVVVIGRHAHGVPLAHAWDYVAGFTAGQDLSERITQKRDTPAQFSLGKSFTNFSPIGPAVVSLDEFASRDSLRVTTTLHFPGSDAPQLLQDGNTSNLIFSVPELVASLSEVLTLYPGDLIFTGTPAGVGSGRIPPMFLQKGQTLVTQIEGIGSLKNTMI